ncbi:MAG: hypothetical protein PHD31_02295 [Candidatus Pacebacteria bacterium]|nr:hypothetical protein [Candidatus Paceibacterota bacterium]
MGKGNHPFNKNIFHGNGDFHKENGKLHNGNGNKLKARRAYFKIGTCPKCKRENVPLTNHHIYPRWVYGPNDIREYLCRECHDEVEKWNREFERMVLRLFQKCYRLIYRAFMNEERYKVVNKTKIFGIAIDGLKKVITRSVSEWIERRMTTEGVSLKNKDRQ